MFLFYVGLLVSSKLNQDPLKYTIIPLLKFNGNNCAVNYILQQSITHNELQKVCQRNEIENIMYHRKQQTFGNTLCIGAMVIVI